MVNGRFSALKSEVESRLTSNIGLRNNFHSIRILVHTGNFPGIHFFYFQTIALKYSQNWLIIYES